LNTLGDLRLLYVRKQTETANGAAAADQYAASAWDSFGEVKFDVIVSRLMLALHELTKFQRIEALFKVEPLGARKPSDLLELSW
jgi:hypothetical protein